MGSLLTARFFGELRGTGEDKDGVDKRLCALEVASSPRRLEPWTGNFFGDATRDALKTRGKLSFPRRSRGSTNARPVASPQMSFRCQNNGKRARKQKSDLLTVSAIVLSSRLKIINTADSVDGSGSRLEARFREAGSSDGHLRVKSPG